MNQPRSKSQPIRKSQHVRFNDVQKLQQRIAAESPAPGDYFYDYKLADIKKEQGILEDEEFHTKFKINFADLPLSQDTLKGLCARSFTKMTQVQRCTIPHALAGRDIMAASRTGSGKTLAYLVPLVQKLYRHRFIPMDGLGAIVLVPVRELAMQVFEVLNSFTGHNELSVGLIIGGKDVNYEQERIKQMNILICTPGRLLQHLEETYGFETNNLQMLVLDEADVMLEMGFQTALNGILSCIPKCQTLFFSATLNSQIHALAALSLSDPERIFLHAAQEPGEAVRRQVSGIYETPIRLKQYFMQVSPEEKLNTLYSFLKSHLKQKILVFVSTCKQARFIYESFRKFRLGSPLYELQGHQKQKKRMAIYFTFAEKHHGILVCTNIAARGLDFPLVDWVLQVDVPQDAETYVHRVGRTARFNAQGCGLVFVSRHQLPLIDDLKNKNVAVTRITQNPQKYFRINNTLQSICSEHQDVKYLAQRALFSYLQFVHKASNKTIFQIGFIDLSALAKSYGLLNAPVISFKTTQKTNPDTDIPEKRISKILKLRQNSKLKKAERKAQKLRLKEADESEHKSFEDDLDHKSVEDEFLTVKGVVKSETTDKPILTASKRQLRRIKDEGHFEGRNKIYFDDNLTAISSGQHRLKIYLQGNREQVDYNAVQEMEQRITMHRQADDQVQKERRKVKRKRVSLQKEEDRHPDTREAAMLEGEDEEQPQ